MSAGNSLNFCHTRGSSSCTYAYAFVSLAWTVPSHPLVNALGGRSQTVSTAYDCYVVIAKVPLSAFSVVNVKVVVEN